MVDLIDLKTISPILVAALYAGAPSSVRNLHFETRSKYT